MFQGASVLFTAVDRRLHFIHKDRTGLVGSVETVLRDLSEKGFKLHAVKCDLFGTKAEWCGPTISQEGIKFNPKSLSGLVDMERPQTAADFQQLLCGSNWQRTSVPNYAQLADPLLQMLRRCQDAVGKAKTRLRSYGLSQLWVSDADRQFKVLRSAIVERVTLSHADQGKALCMHTDASQDYYEAVLTQMPQEDL
jgi:RNase H-like domain found in reverse transcriptase